MINLTINEKGRANNIQRAREQNIIIPTIAQMKDPETIPDKIRDPVIQCRRMFFAVSAKHKADIHGACTKHCFLLFTRGLTDFAQSL